MIAGLLGYARVGSLLVGASGSESMHPSRTIARSTAEAETPRTERSGRSSRRDARSRAPRARAASAPEGDAPATRENAERSIAAPTHTGADAGVPPLTRSPPSTVAIEMTIENTCSVPVDLVWIDFDGRDRPSGNIASGLVRTRPTLEGHVWHLRERASGTTLRVFAAREGMYVQACDRGSALYGPSEPPPPRDPPTICSQGSDETTQLHVRNACDEAIELLWVEYDCSLQSYGRIEPGGERVQQTFVGHVWRARDPRGSVLGETTARADGRAFVACSPQE